MKYPNSYGTPHPLYMKERKNKTTCMTRSECSILKFIFEKIIMIIIVRIIDDSFPIIN